MTLTVNGRVDAQFAPMREVLEALLASGDEVGGAVAVVHHGALVVNLWGGFRDRARSAPWAENTLACAFSTTKGITATCALMAAERGLLDLDAPVAELWPEFAAHGKVRIPVRQLLNHRSGLVGFHEPFPRERFYDWDAVTVRLAAEQPWWEPGTRHGYHARTFGFLVGEVLKRATGDSVGAWLQREIARPLGLDMHIGLHEPDLARCAEIVPARVRAGGRVALPPEGTELMRAMNDASTPTGAAFQNPSLGAGYMNSPEFRTAELPAMNGHATAVSLAMVYDALMSGRLLAPAWLERATLTESLGTDEVLRSVTRFGLGFLLGSEGLRLACGEHAFGHPGAGGSIAFADPEHGFGFAWLMNQMRPGVIGGSPSAVALVECLYRCL